MEIRYGRKRAGIKKELQAKIEEWAASIEDVEVRELIKKNTIVTGGSIASMLLGEPVNDYDVYFRDKATTIAVAKYYVAKWNKDHICDDSTPVVDTRELPNAKGEVEDRVCIFVKSSGVVSEEPFGLNLDTASQEEGSADEGSEKYRVVFMSQNAITLSDKLQIVIRFFGEPDKIHSNYDFAHAMCYWDHGKNELNLPGEALEALLSRTLSYRGSLYPIASIFRMKKFLERGWRITAGQQLKIMWQISELNLQDQYVLTEQLTGVDMAYMYELIGALKSVEAEKINSTYVGVIIDRIFGS
jgi:hypothetical protein